MTNNELISSGELEMYVAGLLPEKRAVEISEIIKKDQFVKQEVDAIESLIMRLAKESNGAIQQDFTGVLKKIISDKILDSKIVEFEPQKVAKDTKVITLKTGIAWAAAMCVLFFAIQYKTSATLNNNLKLSIKENTALQNKVVQQESDINYNSNLLATVTSRNTKIVELAGQDISPEAKVKVFWNRKENKIVLDAASLPIAPEGMVYQVWSLKMNPLTPKSLGLLNGYTEDNRLFALENTNLSEGFGITLEPEGGSKTPTLEKLYVLGTT